jgi:hypothetical protein
MQFDGLFPHSVELIFCSIEAFLFYYFHQMQNVKLKLFEMKEIQVISLIIFSLLQQMMTGK